MSLALALSLPARAAELTEAQLMVIISLISSVPAIEDDGETIDTKTEEPLAYYQAYVADPVVEARCVSCHVANGVARNADLIFTPGDDAANVAAIRSYNDAKNDDGATILARTRGVNHPGGPIFISGSGEYQAFANFMVVLHDGDPADDSADEAVEGEGFFSDVLLAGPKQTLRRAAIILSGRIPSEPELALAVSSDAGLRQAVLDLMAGPGFHDFLIRGANDRLLTDAFLNGLSFDLEDLDGEGAYQYPVAADAYLLPENFTAEETQDRKDFRDRYGMGLARAPLELIAYVVENNRPYTEILTADYTMVNRYTAEVFRSDVHFGAEEDHTVFKPGHNRGLVLRGSDYSARAHDDRGWEILSHGPYVDYPHAGILNEPAWLARYPSTDTNRNRARARWTYHHFLGVDIEASAPRTTDPAALADTNNPTKLNANCTVCHDRLDPIAGAYQNYGDEGLFRDFPGYRCSDNFTQCEVFGGTDSLPWRYKFRGPENDPAYPPYQLGDTWYRDLVPPGISGVVLPSERVDDSLRWLGEQITSDPRFADATVAFWWPAIMGRPVLAAPVFSQRTDFDQLVSAFDAQQSDIFQMAAAFRSEGYDLRELLADMVLSPWFRATGIDPDAVSQRNVELSAIGTDRLLGPEELERKNESVLGYAWDKDIADTDRYMDGFHSALDDEYRLYYGGIDSHNVEQRETTLTSLMSNVAERQALEMACGVTALEFIQPIGSRRLFSGVEKHVTPAYELGLTTEVAIANYDQRGAYEVIETVGGGAKYLTISLNNHRYDSASEKRRSLFIDAVQIFRNGILTEVLEAEDFELMPGFEQTLKGNGSGVGKPVRVDSETVGWKIARDGYVRVQITLPDIAEYTVRTIAWGSDADDGVPPEMTVEVTALTPDESTRGTRLLLEQMQAIYQRMLGDELPTSDPEIAAAYDLLLETWLARQSHENNDNAWNTSAEQCLFPRKTTAADTDAGLRDDPKQMVYAWSSVLYYFMTHFDYLHE